MNPRHLLLLGLIVVAAGSRVAPHAWNVAPITALALLGGACLPRAWQALCVWLAVMLLSDAALTLTRPDYPFPYPGIMFVYGAFALMVGMGVLLRRRRRLLPVAAAAVLASITFYLVSNLGVWLMSGMYPYTFAGLGQCYGAAIPFFKNALAGDLLFTVGLFAAYAWGEKLIRPRVADQVISRPA